MLDDILEVYRASGRFARALPLLFLVPALVEFAQHVAEVSIGMYDSRAAARALAGDPLRLAFGFAKTLALIFPGYWFVRFMAFDHDTTRAAALEQPAAGLFAVQFLLLAAIQWLGLFGPSVGASIGAQVQAAQVASVVLALAQSVLGIYLIAWFVAWPLGNRSVGPLRSVQMIAGSFWRSVGYLLACTIPLMTVHYALGLGAVGLAPALRWPMLVADALAVGFLALTMYGGNFVAARAAAARSSGRVITA